MVITISLVAGDACDDVVEVTRTVEVHAAGDGWRTDLVGAIGDHARETARCLAEQLAPALPEPAAPFTLLKDVLSDGRSR